MRRPRIGSSKFSFFFSSLLEIFIATAETVVSKEIRIGIFHEMGNQLELGGSTSKSTFLFLTMDDGIPIVYDSNSNPTGDRMRLYRLCLSFFETGRAIRSSMRSTRIMILYFRLLDLLLLPLLNIFRLVVQLFIIYVKIYAQVVFDDLIQATLSPPVWFHRARARPRMLALSDTHHHFS